MVWKSSKWKRFALKLSAAFLANAFFDFCVISYIWECLENNLLTFLFLTLLFLDSLKLLIICFHVSVWRQKQNI